MQYNILLRRLIEFLIACMYMSFFYLKFVIGHCIVPYTTLYSTTGSTIIPVVRSTVVFFFDFFENLSIQSITFREGPTCTSCIRRTFFHSRQRMSNGDREEVFKVEKNS